MAYILSLLNLEHLPPERARATNMRLAQEQHQPVDLKSLQCAYRPHVPLLARR